MQKGYKREGRGMAVLRCFIGLLIMIVVILLAYFMLQLDYSDKLSPDASMRPYVEVTPSPEPTETPALAAVPEASAEATLESLVTPTPQPELTSVPTQSPTPEPTEAPTPEPTATPEPTSIPESELSALKFSGFKLPSLSTKDAQLGVTHCYRSVADSNRYLQIQGYAFVDDETFDAAEASLYLVITRSSGQSALALPAKKAGISGVDHSASNCANASESDFEAILDVQSFPDDIYTLGMVFNYTVDGKGVTEYYTFPETETFTVLNGQVISEIPVEQP